MAEFLWTFAVQELLKLTVKLAADQIGLARGFKKELSKLKDSLLVAEATLRDVDKIKPDLESQKLWVKKLEDIVFEADVLLDELAYEDVRRKVETEKVLMVRSFFSLSKNFVVFRLKMANKITAVAKKLNEHYSTKSPLGSGAANFKEDETDLNETDSFLDEIEIIGRETEVLHIVNDLFALRSQEKLVVLPIVGPGGIGKTTLVKEVFHHEKIRKNFDTYIWVCVSDPFHIKKILRAILKRLDPDYSGSDEREAILQKLEELLSGKKYFLVLDDVWNEDRNKWNNLRDSLLKINKNFGNVVVVTTRSDKVAEIMNTHNSHHLEKLSDDHCWSLFEKCAFESELSIISKVIREELVKKFGGIPLVVKVLGGMVKSCKNDEEVQSTLENLRRIALQDENHILSTIKLSVDRLPSSSLKQCFAYCSNFPPDFDFYKEELVQMWIAQGFIQLDNKSNLLMEVTGAKYFDILLSRSLFQDVYKDERGKIISCKMHDLIYDVACSISNYKNLRLGLETNEKSQDDEVLSINERRRTVYWSENVPVDNLGKITNFIYLRVLIIDSWSIRELPDSIVKLKHLRYLDILRSQIKELPKSIVLLYNLQTLKLCGAMKELPTKLRKLVNLRHLKFRFDGSYESKKMPKHLSQLTQLQTLSQFVVDCEEGCKIEELGLLKELKGELRIFCLEQVKSKKEAMTANLKEKENISDLCFHWSDRKNREDWNENVDLNVLEGLQPHKNLQVLRIENFGGKLLPNGIFVENLVELYLCGCHKCETLPMFGQLSKLKVLQIYDLSYVKSIGDEFYGDYPGSKTLFPKLKTFEVFGMFSLELWEEVAPLSNCTTFPHLETLKVMFCPKLTNIPNIFATPSDRLEVDTINTSFQGPPKLLSLHICTCDNLIKLPSWLEYCTSLEELEIDNNFLGDISPPHLQKIQNLASLSIKNFQKLPDGLACNHNLQVLKVEGPMEDFDWSPFIHLNSLEVLKLYETGSNPLREFPRQLEHLIALKYLSFLHFDSVESLPEWLENFTSLESLELYNCKNLKSLPSKEVMSNLTRLKALFVYSCSRLDLSEGGSERAKVSHVPYVRVH